MRTAVPKYVRHKARNCAKVTINGKVHDLPGDFNSEESKAAYGRLIAESLTNPNAPELANVTLRFLAAVYRQSATSAKKGQWFGGNNSGRDFASRKGITQECAAGAALRNNAAATCNARRMKKAAN